MNQKDPSSVNNTHIYKLLADAMLRVCDNNGEFVVDDIMLSIEAEYDSIDYLSSLTNSKYIKALLFNIGKDESVKRALKSLYNNGYIFSKTTDVIKLTSEGLKSKKYGGHAAYLKYIQKQDELEIKIKNLTVNSTKWSPRFAGLAALTGIMAFILQLVNILVIQPRQEKIDQLQKQVQGQDNMLRIHQTRIDSLSRAKDTSKKSPSGSLHSNE
jgi:hypothetical protein